MSLDKATVQKIAYLARIEVKEEELEPLAKELSGILQWVEQLAEVNSPLSRPASASAMVRCVKSLMAYSTTLGTRKKPLAVSGPFNSTFSG